MIIFPNKRVVAFMVWLCFAVRAAMAAEVELPELDRVEVSAVLRVRERDAFITVNGIVRERILIAPLVAWMKNVKFSLLPAGKEVDAIRTSNFCEIKCYSGGRAVGNLSVFETMCVYRMYIPEKRVHEKYELTNEQYISFRKWLDSTGLGYKPYPVSK